MKKFILIAAVSMAAMYANGQNPVKGVLKLNPVSLLVKTGNISFEKVTGAAQSFQLGAFYSGVSLGDFDYKGFGITPEYRFYFGGQKQALNGGYVAPFLRYQNFSIGDKTSEANAKFYSLGGGAVIGWEKTYKSGFVLDFFAGPSYNSVTFKSGAQDDFDIKGGIKGFGLRTGIALGFTF
jgi:hypothetical protein